jgi:hypothetical protein
LASLTGFDSTSGSVVVSATSSLTALALVLYVPLQV